MRLILVLCIAYCLSINSIHGLESWCRSFFEGFSLDNDYNRNSPPIQPRIVAGKFKKFILNTQTTLWDIDAVDDKKQYITVTILRKYKWKDKRISVNLTHPYWRSATNDTRKYVRLDSDFAERCLWMPQLQFVGARKMILHNPSPTAIDNSAMEVYLTKRNTIEVSFLNLQLTLFCTMDFLKYPFDRQVCSVTETLTSSTHGERINWNISGSFNYRPTLFRPSRQEKRHELQYAIDPEPAIKNISRVVLMNATLPAFSWEIHLKRLLLPYIFKTFVPMTTLVMTSWISFLIPPESVPGRSGLLVTLILVLTTFHLHELDQSPVISSITPLLIWSEICLAFVFFAFLEYSCILFFLRFPNEGKNKIKGRSGINPMYMIRKEEHIGKDKNAKDDQNVSKTQMSLERRDKRASRCCKDAISEKITASTLDYWALQIFPIGFIFVLIVYFGHFCF